MANINNLNEKKEIPSCDRESNKWPFSFPRWNPHTTKGLRFNSGLGTGIFPPFFRFPLSSYFWITTIMIQKIQKQGFFLKCQKIYHQSTTASNKRTSKTWTNRMTYVPLKVRTKHKSKVRCKANWKNSFIYRNSQLKVLATTSVNFCPFTVFQCGFPQCIVYSYLNQSNVLHN